jgi:TldD protein
VHARTAPVRYISDDPVASGRSADRVELLRTIDAYIRSLDPRVSQVTVSLSASHEAIVVAASDGVLAGDVRPLVRLDIRVLMEEGSRREQGFAGGGGRYSMDELMATDTWQAYANEAVRQARESRRRARAGRDMTVVLGPGWPGVLLHEAIGHGLEGDFNRKGTSAFSNRIGERVASEGVHDGGRRHPGQPARLAQHRRRGHAFGLHHPDRGRSPGGYMQDKLNARLMGVEPTGNGRRESFAHLPMPRMTNTYMLPGQHDPGRDHRLGRRRDLRGEFQWRPGRHHLRQVRVRGQRGLPDQERQASAPRSRAPR